MARRRLIRLGILIAIAALVVVGFWRSSAGPSVEPGTTLVIDLSGSFVEAPKPPLVARVLGESRRPLVSLLSTFAMARRDDRIGAVVLKIGSLGVGWGKAQEIRDAIGSLREAGVRTVAHIELADFAVSKEYYIATAAERITVGPGSLAPVVGLAAEYLFLGGLWEKLGIVVESERIGAYKTAVDSYTGTEMTAAHREMANSLLDSIDEQFIGGIAVGRDMTVAQVRYAIDVGPVTPDELVRLELADEVRHFDALDEIADKTVMEAADYAAIDPASVGFAPVAQFAVIYGSGTVVSGEGRQSPNGSPVFAAETIREALESAADDDEIDAIILRIDSPGGSSLASEQVWHAMQRAKESGKPLIASLSDVAASGGYYAAVAADRIVAPPGVLTGSIGVFVLRPALGGFFDKVGVSVTSLTRGEHADFLLSSEPLSSGARRRLRDMVADTYELFVGRVAAGRGLDPERVDVLGRGRVYTGAQALELGLIDELGGLPVAVAAGRRALGLDEDADVALLTYPPPMSLAEEISDALQSRIARQVSLSLPLPPAALRFGAWLASLPSEGLLLVPPVLVEIR